MMEYKGYTGQITSVDEVQGTIHGEVSGINDVVTFEGKTAEEVVQAFHDSVDDYLAFCEERSESPEKPFSGKFLVRIAPALHQQASLAAKKAGESLNAWVASAIKARLSTETAKTPSHEFTHGREEWDVRTLLYLLELVESRRQPAIPARFMVPETDPIMSTILRLVLAEKLKGSQSSKEEAEKGRWRLVLEKLKEPQSSKEEPEEGH